MILRTRVGLHPTSWTRSPDCDRPGRQWYIPVTYPNMFLEGDIIEDVVHYSDKRWTITETRTRSQPSRLTVRKKHADEDYRFLDSH